MKRKNKKLLTLLLAGTLCTATVGAAMLSDGKKAAADDVTYTLSEVFGSEGADVSAKKVVETDTAETTAFTFADGENVRLKKSLALKWFEGKNDAKYLTVKFAFADLNFKSMAFEVESISAWATEQEKTKNSLVFTNETDGVYAVVLNDGETLEKVNAARKVKVEVAAGTEMQFSLTEATDAEDGEFEVLVTAGSAAAVNVGTFTNVGANHSKYEYDKMHPLTVVADVETADAETTLYLDEINGQRFDNITTDSESKKVVKDTAAPVLIVNEDLNGFYLGAAYSLNYEVVDVLQDSVTAEGKYYQYNPKDAKPIYEDANGNPKKISTSVYFYDTTYEKDGKQTSVYEQEKMEYVSILYTVSDAAHNTAETKKTYDLSWYALSTVEKEQGEGATAVKTDFIKLDRSTQGATYKIIDKTNGTNEKTANYDSQVAAYQKLVNEAAKDVYAGSNSSIKFPSLAWLFDDDNGYRNLKFTICYMTPESSSSTSSLNYDGLKLDTSAEGLYKFKVFATDKASNKMQYYLDGELVDVNSSNIWDIEEIPEFVFEIENRGLKIEDDSVADRTDTEILDEKYTLTDITVVGASSLKENYALYKLDLSKYNNSLEAGKAQITESVLSGISYESLQSAVAGKLASVTDKNYMKVYYEVYVSLVAAAVDGSVEAVAACFTEIKEHNALITEEDVEEWEAYNKYEWKPTEQTFKSVEEGEYLILADFWEADLPLQRAAAYKLVVVDSEADSIKGESNWLKQNLVSVILFSIAGVMLIFIIILLLIKPSDETLEDVDAKATEKKSGAKKNKDK